MAEERPSRAQFATFRTMQTRWMDNDVYGHMNNVVHYSLFDSAVNGWLIDKGLLNPTTSESYGLVVETGCKYHAQLRYPEPVHAGLRVSHVGRSSVRFEIGLFADGEDLAAANGFFIHVYVDRDSQRPVEIDESRRKAFETIIL